MAPLPHRTPTEQIAPALLLTPLGAAVAQVEEAAGDVLVFLTGAGWSADSGLAVYKDIADIPPGSSSRR